MEGMRLFSFSTAEMDRLRELSVLISVKMENLIFVWMSGISGIQRIFEVSDVN